MKRKLKEHLKEHAPPAAGQLHMYASQEYWQLRYSNLNTANSIEFEWLHSYDAIKPLFQFLVKLDASVLDVGCGTSRFVGDLRADGHRGRVVAIDYSRAAVECLRHLLGGAVVCSAPGAEIELLQMDAREMKFEDSSFQCVFDKVSFCSLLRSSVLWFPSRRIYHWFIILILLLSPR